LAASARDESLREALARLRSAVDARLGALTPSSAAADSDVEAAVSAALLSPGKRVRPILALLVTEAFGGDSAAAVEVACVPEMVHAASLVLDDLPCMDDASLRRGRAALHRQFGEAIAILAAFALLARSHALLPRALAASGVPPAHRAVLEQRLAEVVGAMCYGQALDLAPRVGPADLGILEKVHASKTGALFELAAELGAAAAGVHGPALDPVLSFSRNLGLAFQVSDDLLDEEGSQEQLGKSAGRDAVLGRATFVSVFGVDGARAIRDRLTAAATSAIARLGDRSRLLRELAEHVRTRTA
jgi:geranylgeranyl pyrophosphate synthase